jgi:CheY-like chemotaxis protein
MPSVLIVDDDAEFRSAIGRVLRAGGHQIHLAANATQALSAIRDSAPDVLITDVIMPGGDGIELLTAVKRDYPSVWVLAVSGRGHIGGLDLLAMAKAVGADATLAKPFSVEELLGKMALAPMLRR